jgi:hypothetical protein
MAYKTGDGMDGTIPGGSLTQKIRQVRKIAKNKQTLGNWHNKTC